MINWANPASRLRVLRVNTIRTLATASAVSFFTRRREGREGWVRTVFVLPIFAFALVAAGLPRADDASLRTAIQAIYTPYNLPTDTESSMDRQVFSAPTKALIAKWKASVNNEGEVTDLSSADWFCQCQDWDPEKFRVISIRLLPLARGKVRADVALILARGAPGRLRLIMTRERGKWLVDDLISVNGYPNLTTGLYREIAEATASK